MRKNNHTIKLSWLLLITLISWGPVVIAQATKNDAQLIKAILTQNTLLAERLLDDGADPNAILGSLNESALIYAITRTESDALVKKLLQQGADPQLRDYNNNLPLAYAVTAGKLVVVEALIEHGADVNAPLEQGNSVLILAVQNNHLAIAKALLDAGANANHRNTMGFSPHMIAVHNKTHELRDLLANRGAVREVFDKQVSGFVIKQISYELGALNAAYNYCAQCSDGNSRCAHCQTINNHNETLDLTFLQRRDASSVGGSSLMGVISREGKDILGHPYRLSPGKNGVHVADQTFDRLLQYMKKAPIPLQQEYTDFDANVTAVLQQKNSPTNTQPDLEVARKMGQLSIEMEQAKSSGDEKKIAQLNQAARALGDAYQLQVMDAAQSVKGISKSDRYDEVRNQLIKALGAPDLDRKIGESKRRPIELVVSERNSLYLMKLLQLPIEINALDNRHLSTAIGQQNTLVLRLLLAHGANPNLPDKSGNYPIHEAVNYPAQLSLLLQHGADTTPKNQRGETADDMVARLGNQFSQQLLSKAQEAQTPGQAFETLMSQPIQTDVINKIKQLQQQGLKLNSTAFDAAVNHNRLAVVQLLLDEGVSVKNVQIEYPILRTAASNNYLELAELLIEQGAAVDEPGHPERKTPLMLAVINRNLSMTKLLLQSGADIDIKERHGMTVRYHATQTNDPEFEDLFHPPKPTAPPRKKKTPKAQVRATTPGAITQNEAYFRAVDLIRSHVEPNVKINPWDLIDSQKVTLVQVDGKEIWQVEFTQINSEGVRLAPLIIKFSAPGELLSISK